MNNDKYPERKIIRLKDFPYNSNNAYFITICSFGRKHLFGKVVSDGDFSARVDLSPVGKIIEKFINSIESSYEGVTVENFVIMPNHVHILFTLYGAKKPVSQIISALKSLSRREAGYQIWQNRFYDTVIDSYEVLEDKYNYINNNPMNWILNKNREDY